MRKSLIAFAFVAACAIRASALTPSELTAEEQAKFKLVQSNPAASESFLQTRGYVHLARKIVAEPGNVEQAKSLRVPKKYDAKYLFLADDLTIINKAIDISLDAVTSSMVA